MSEPGITCREVVEIVNDYLEDALSPADRTRFEEHVAGCEGCTNYLAQMRETVRLTGSLTEERVPEDQRRELLDAFRDWRRGRR
jgi:predicted anti-sigma-YlaC factor YlaD